MKKSDWGIEITRVENGFLIKDNEGSRTVVEAKADDDLEAAEQLLQHVLEFFNLEGKSRYDRERLAMIRQVGDKYAPTPEEKIVNEYYRKVVPKTRR